MSENKVVIPSAEELMKAFNTPVAVDLTASAFDGPPPPREFLILGEGSAKKQIEIPYLFEFGCKKPKADQEAKEGVLRVTEIPNWETMYPDLDASVRIQRSRPPKGATQAQVEAFQPVVQGFMQEVTAKLDCPGSRHNGTLLDLYISTVVPQGATISRADSYIKYFLSGVDPAVRPELAAKHQASMTHPAKLRLLREILSHKPRNWAFIEWEFSWKRGDGSYGAIKGMKSFPSKADGGKVYYIPQTSWDLKRDGQVEGQTRFGIQEASLEGFTSTTANPVNVDAIRGFWEMYKDQILG